MKFNVYDLKSLNLIMTRVNELSKEISKDTTLCHYIEEVIIHDEGDQRVGVIKYDSDQDALVFRPNAEYFQEGD